MESGQLIAEKLNVVPCVFDGEVVIPAEAENLPGDLDHGDDTGAGAESVHGETGLSMMVIVGNGLYDYEKVRDSVPQWRQS